MVKFKRFFAKPIVWVVILCVLGAGSFWAMQAQSNRTAEIGIYNNGVRLLEEGSLQEALGEFAKVVETPPHNSRMDALAEYQIAWILAALGDGSFETLQNVRGLWTSALRKYHPDKDTAINLELIISEMEEVLAEEGIPSEQIDDIIDGNEQPVPADGPEPNEGGGQESDY